MDSFPERPDVHGAMQLEQRFLQCRIDYRLRFTAGPAVFAHVLPPSRALRKERALEKD